MEKKQQRQALSERVAAYEASGQTMAAWSAKEGLTIHRLARYARNADATQEQDRRSHPVLPQPVEEVNRFSGRRPLGDR